MTSRNETEYFAREEIEKLYKLAKELAAKRAADEQESLKQLHWMHCPKCGHELHAVSFHGVEIDRCFHCHGTWLDHGDLERVSSPEDPHKILEAIVNTFKHHGQP